MAKINQFLTDNLLKLLRLQRKDWVKLLSMMSHREARSKFVRPIQEKIRGKIDKTYIRLRSWQQLQMGRFLQKIPLHLDISDYEVFTIRSIAELQDVLRLRYEVFIQEGLNKTWPVRVDLDKYDFLADHLVVRHKPTNRIIGTYRLISSSYSNVFYSQSEFELDDLLSRDGTKLEMGRACIHKDFRNGSVIAVLWRGVRQYMALTDTRYMFGCASIKTMDISEISLIYHYLMENSFISNEFNIKPTEAFKIKELSASSASALLSSSQDIRGLIPTLLRSYFKAGARVVGEPALDREFKCIDFLTVLDVVSLNEAYDKKFSRA